jgi:probable F420-dependent oxidoreductase
MRFGVQLPQYGRFAGPDALLRMARAAEDLGWDAVWTSDHVVIPRPHTDRFTEVFYDVIATLGFVAARTGRVRLGTSVLLLPYRHPVMLAKQVATLDALSKGRTIIGVAPGWMAEEFEILGVPHRGRGKLHDETLRAMIQMWTSEDTAFAGEHYRFPGFAFAPRPVQKPYPPIWIGGNDRRALRRTVELGTGWHPITSLRIGLTLEQLGERIRELRELAGKHGRDPEEITLSLRAPLAFEAGPGRLSEFLTFIGDPDAITRRLDRCAALGITDVLFDTFYSMPDRMETGTIEDFVATMERFTREVRPRLAAGEGRACS